MLTVIILLLLAILLAVLFPKLMRGVVVLALVFVGYVFYTMNADVQKAHAIANSYTSSHR